MKSKLLVQKIDINQIIKSHIEEEAIPVEVDFQYDYSVHKLKIEKSKIKLPTDTDYMEDPKRGLIVKTIEVFTKKFPNLERQRFYLNRDDIFEMLKELQLPKRLDEYFDIIEAHFNKKKKQTHDSKYDYSAFNTELREYVMKKL